MPSLRAWAERFGLDAPRLINMYGLTEATVHTTVHRLSAADLAREESVIGRPLPGFVARVVDPDGHEAQSGELVVAGPQVVPGYLNRPEATAARFGPDPLGLREDLLFYRTGDRVCLRDGDLGRVDRQVKIRGHRLELGEIEAAALALPDVTEAVVVVLEEASGTILGCGYTTRSGTALPARQLRGELLSRIPQYMLPARFRWFERLPLTVNGKTDSLQVATQLRAA
jgi:acyl-CoA synthetase (AMP-forming)/AMP-acid ligase II